MKTEPALSPENCLAEQARRTARALSQRFNHTLEPDGLTTGQFALLATLHVLPGLSAAALAEALGSDPSTLARALKPLEARGLIQREGGLGRDGRAARLTQQGEQTLAAARQRWETSQSALWRALGGPEQAGRLLDALRQLEKAARDAP